MEALLIGVGGLGTAAALALTTATPVRLGLVDADVVDLSNLHRQLLYRLDEQSVAKVKAAEARLKALVPGLEIESVQKRLDTVDALAEIMARYPVTLDGSDNYTTRLAVNDAALQVGKPLVHGAAIGWRGQLMAIDPGRSACLRCLFEEAPDEDGGCRREGVMGPVVAEIGRRMALEAVKIVSGSGEPLWNRMVTVDGWNNRRRTITIAANSMCPACHAGTTQCRA
ncbi:MAG: HesA/MoeB/ThiF family protein [Magnetococcales bacterium]|nr:HesA/MoeB/ThiF family protein [Magnetococcales bacterium]